MRFIVLGAPKNYEALWGNCPTRSSFQITFVRILNLFTASSHVEVVSGIGFQPMIRGTWAGCPCQDVTEDVIRSVALPLGLVDTKVCAINDTWPGLKLMIRRENRARKIPAN